MELKLWARQGSGHRFRSACAGRQEKKPSKQQQHTQKSPPCPHSSSKLKKSNALVSIQDPIAARGTQGHHPPPSTGTRGTRPRGLSTVILLGLLPECSGAPAREHLHPTAVPNCPRSGEGKAGGGAVMAPAEQLSKLLTEKRRTWKGARVGRGP